MANGSEEHKPFIQGVKWKAHLYTHWRRNIHHVGDGASIAAGFTEPDS